MDGNPSPIVLFAYKRPDHTRRCLESLAQNTWAPESQLIIYCEAPKNPAEIGAVAQVRALVKSRRWCADVSVIERERHLGLAQSVLTGVTETLQQHESVIVLEDDLVLAPRFLEFTNHALYHYRNKPR